MNHFKSNITSPLFSVIVGYIYIIILVIILYIKGFYENSTFFSIGVPITLFGKTIDDNNTYYTILILFFIHQLINNFINNITYPWLINCIQDPKSKNIIYSKKTSLLIINLFSLYSELDVILIVSGIMSQISFFFVIILANVISDTFINWQYIKKKNNIVFSNLIQDDNYKNDNYENDNYDIIV
jgi:hypothetical protein